MDKNRILSAKDLSKTFSNESVQQHVLKNLNLEIYKGDFTVIMGNSGSGKSTLLYALSGMDRPSLGKVTYYVDGTEVERVERLTCQGQDIEPNSVIGFAWDKLASVVSTDTEFIIYVYHLKSE
jgi:ABC-type nitrate/sulfonate/bicarbonate transport system ATPase subunit